MRFGFAVNVRALRKSRRSGGRMLTRLSLTAKTHLLERKPVFLILRLGVSSGKTDKTLHFSAAGLGALAFADTLNF